MSNGDVRKSEATATSVESFVWPENCKRMRDAIAYEFELIGINVNDAVLKRIVDTPAIRDAFIVSIYNAERANGEKAEYLYYRLGEIFAVGWKTVRNIVQTAHKKSSKTNGNHGNLKVTIRNASNG